MHPTVKPRVATDNSTVRDQYRIVVLEALSLAMLLVTFTLVSIGLAAGIRSASSLLVPAVQQALIQPIFSNWPSWP